MELKTWLVVGLGVMLAGCASVPPSQAPDEDVIAAATATAKASVNAGLTARVLEAGQCGLFLFTRTDPARLIFFYSADAESGDFHDGTQEYDLTIEAADGDLFGQFFTHMEFSTVNGQVIDLRYSAGEEMDGGARISDGRIIVTDEEGWEIIMPVAGVRACQPDAAERA